MNLNSTDIIKYIIGENTSIEMKHSIEKWRAHNSANQKEYDILKLIYEQKPTAIEFPTFSRDGDWDNLMQKVSASESTNNQATPSAVGNKSSKWLINFLIMATLATLVYFFWPRTYQNNANDGPYAEILELELPDGTTVKLNGKSRIRYKTSMATDPTRDVELIGDATFEVASDPDHPFVLHTDGAGIKVLGTTFVVARDVNNSQNAVISNLEGLINCYEIVKPSNSQTLKKGDKVVWDGKGFDYIPAFVPAPAPKGKNYPINNIIDYLTQEQFEQIVELSPYMLLNYDDVIFVDKDLPLSDLLEQLKQNGNIQYTKLPGDRYYISELKSK